MILLCIELFKELIWEKFKKSAAGFCACGLVLVSFYVIMFSGFHALRKMQAKQLIGTG